MRETKFRIWNSRYKEFRFWGFIDKVFIGIPTGAGLTIEECKRLSQQYIGLKDKNGKEIYAGDIVLHGYGPKQIPVIVLYQAPSFIMKEKIKDKSWSGFILADTKNQFEEIIGNTYENPELLKK